MRARISAWLAEQLRLVYSGYYLDGDDAASIGAMTFVVLQLWVALAALSVGAQQ